MSVLFCLGLAIIGAGMFIYSMLRYPEWTAEQFSDKHDQNSWRK